LLKFNWLKGLSGLKALLPNPWFLLIGLSLITGAYLYGLNAGSSSMETKKNLEIQKIVNKQNKERTDWNTKLADLEIKSFDQTLQFKNLQITSVVEREKLITQWRTQWKTQVIEKNCGLSASAVELLNRLQEVRP